MKKNSYWFTLLLMFVCVAAYGAVVISSSSVIIDKTEQLDFEGGPTISRSGTSVLLNFLGFTGPLAVDGAVSGDSFSGGNVFITGNWESKHFVCMTDAGRIYGYANASCP